MRVAGITTGGCWNCARGAYDSLNADLRELSVRPESGSPRMGDNAAGKLLRGVEGAAYWAAVAPTLARLPAAVGYRIACWRGDLLFRCQARKRAELTRNVRLVLGDELNPRAEGVVTVDPDDAPDLLGVEAHDGAGGEHRDLR